MSIYLYTYMIITKGIISIIITIILFKNSISVNMLSVSVSIYM